LGGTTYAATGGNFILGTSNVASSRTSLSAPISDRALQLTNANTGAGATALGLNVASGHAPFTVNSGTKVAHLNADKLDGIDSSGLVRGRGTLLSNRLVFVPTTTKTLFVMPGLGELRASCLPTYGQIEWHNTTDSSIDLWKDYGGSWASGVVDPTNYQPVANSDVRSGGMFAVGLGSDPGIRRIATVQVFAVQVADGEPCVFQAQGTIWTSG
jgi:hypothetical protein